MIRLLPHVIRFEITTGMIDWAVPVHVPGSVLGAGAVSHDAPFDPEAGGELGLALVDPQAAASTAMRASATRVVARRRGRIGEKGTAGRRIALSSAERGGPRDRMTAS
jgi:hypothetical protein